MTDEPGYDEWLAEAAKGCRCCADCWEVPCGGCQAGGICDNHCACYTDTDRCGDDYSEDGRSEDDDAGGGDA